MVLEPLFKERKYSNVFSGIPIFVSFFRASSNSELVIMSRDFVCDSLVSMFLRAGLGFIISKISASSRAS